MLNLLTVLVLLLAASSPQANPLSRQSAGGYFKWGTEPVRGVNLGGWLVLEVSIRLQLWGVRLTLQAMDNAVLVRR